jgi:hypothetical protein
MLLYIHLQRPALRADDQRLIAHAAHQVHRLRRPPAQRQFLDIGFDPRFQRRSQLLLDRKISVRRTETPDPLVRSLVIVIFNPPPDPLPRRLEIRKLRTA